MLQPTTNRRGRRRAAAAQVYRAGLRRIAQAGIGAALPAEFKRREIRIGELHFQAVAIDSRITKIFVVVRLARRQLGLDPRWQPCESQALLVEVIAGRNVPAQHDSASVRLLDVQRERFVHGQKVLLLLTEGERRSVRQLHGP